MNHPSHASRRAIEISTPGTAKQIDAGGRSVTFVPLIIKRRHTRKLLVPPAGAPQTSPKVCFDFPLIRTLGKAFYWQSLIESGAVANATELAHQLKLEPGWVSEVLRLTLLAPDIVQAILEGHQPRHLNLITMRGRKMEIPANWEAQRKCFEAN